MISISRDDLIALAINLIKSKVCFFVVNCIRKNCEWQRNRQGEKNLSLPIRKDSWNKWSRFFYQSWKQLINRPYIWFHSKYNNIYQVGTFFDEINDNLCC
jgi:hypothetical protein